MIFDNPSLIRLKAIFRIITRVTVFVIALATMYGLYLFIPDRSPDVDLQSMEVKEEKHSTRSVCSLDSEALTIDAVHEDFHLPSLIDEISLVGVSSRPDFESARERMLLYLKGSKQGVIANPGEKLFLCFIDGKLRFSDYATPLWLKTLPEYGGAEISISLWLPMEGRERVIADSITFHLNLSPQKNGKTVIRELDGLSSEVMHTLTSMQWWGQDELYSTYGGVEYKDRVGKERLVLGNGKEILFLQKGDYLFWNGRKWRVASRADLLENQYIARVRSINSSKLEMDIWGKEGVFRQPITFSKAAAKLSDFKMDQVMTRIRQRTSSRVSCKLGQKNTILRRGDWILHQSGSWHVLRTLDEIEKYLDHKTKGDLFVLDGVEKEDGKGLLRGHLFDESRSHVEPIALSLTQKEKKKEVVSRRPQRRRYPVDDFDDDFDDEDDDFNDENDEYLHLMNARRRHAMSDDY
jgi:hypothetical protein